MFLQFNSIQWDIQCNVNANFKFQIVIQKPEANCFCICLPNAFTKAFTFAFAFAFAFAFDLLFIYLIIINSNQHKLILTKSALKLSIWKLFFETVFWNAKIHSLNELNRINNFIILFACQIIINMGILKGLWFINVIFLNEKFFFLIKIIMMFMFSWNV